MRILIIAEGILAKHFLDRVVSLGTSHTFDVVHYTSSVLPHKKPENFTFHKFDPTSFSKLSPLLGRNYGQVMLVLAKKNDLLATYKNIRMVHDEMLIYILDKWDLQIEDKNLFLLNLNKAMSKRFSDYLPGVPVVAQNVGQAQGEIMEVRVPFGSSYVYRHIDTIEQTNWRISAIYRGQNLLLPKNSLMIQPNDVLLLIGNPTVLKNVYQSIKRELGQFPMPFGNNVYCYIDMRRMGEYEIKKATDDALILHAKLNNAKLVIRVVNPCDITLLEKIKRYSGARIDVCVAYTEQEFDQIVTDDIHHYDIGLAIVTHTVFKHKKNRRTLYRAKIALLKVSPKGFFGVKKAGVLASSDSSNEKMSTFVFDVSNQLGIKLSLYDFDPEGHNVNAPLLNHYRNLAKLYNVDVQTVKLDLNPIVALKEEDTLLHYVNFTRSIVEANVFSYFSTSFEKLHFKFKNSNQLFIPTL